MFLLVLILSLVKVHSLDLNLGRLLQRSKTEETPKSELDKLLSSVLVCLLRIFLNIASGASQALEGTEAPVPQN